MDYLDKHMLSDAVLNSFPGIAFLQSENGYFLRWNRNFEDILGYSAREIVSIRNDVFFQEEDKPIISKIINEVFDNGYASVEMNIILKNGRLVPFFISGKAIIYENQRCLIGHAIDLTEKYQLKEKSNQIAFALNERIKELNTLHATSKLLQAKKSSVDEILIQLTQILPHGWQYPEKTAVKIEYDQKVFKSENYRFSDYILKSQSDIADGRELTIEIIYLEDKFDLISDPFLIEEQKLIDSILKMVVNYLNNSKEAEALSKSEANLKSIFDNTDTSYILIDPSFNIVMFNKIAYDRTMFIFNKRLMVGQSMLNIVDETRRPGMIERYSKILRGESLEYEVSFEKNGQNYFFLTKLTPIHADGDRINGICFTSLDFNERKKFETHRELFVSIVNSSQDAIISKNLEGIITSWNQGAEKVFGYSADETIGNPIQMLNVKNLYNEEVDFTSQIKLGRVIQNLETTRITKEGKSIIVSLSESPVKNIKGEIEGSAIILRDITQKKQIEESLEKSEANFRTILDATHIGYVLVDVDLKIISYNICFLEFMKKKLNIDAHYEDQIIDFFNSGYEEINEYLHKALLGDEFSFETKLTQEDRINWYHMKFNPIKHQKNQPIGVLLSIEDITKSKNEEINRLKLTNDIIQRNKDLEQFAYIVSHNLRAPVANIIGLSRELSDPSYPETDRILFLKELTSSVSKLDGIIKDLNETLKMKKEINEKKEEIVFKDLVSDIQKSIQHMITESQVSIHIDFDSIDSIRSTKSYLYSIFYNLITNSIKYRNQNQKPTIKIKSLPSNDKVLINFSDNGLGIDLEKKGDQVFGMYKRFHTGAADGKGMGLFITKTQVEAIGGKISIYSKVNVGTEFIIELPVAG